ncbi:MAG: hypothetical protein ACYCZT_10640 [Thiobacillus sp.]
MNHLRSMRVSLTGILLGIVSLSLIGCASLNQAGTASYTIKPMLIDGRTVCCEVAVVNGKQYASLDATLIKTGNDYTVTLSERGVEAFRGQEIAAGAAASAGKTALKAVAIGGAVLIAPIAAPAIGAALAAPGLGAAAAGAGALAVGQQMAK